MSSNSLLAEARERRLRRQQESAGVKVDDVKTDGSRAGGTVTSTAASKSTDYKDYKSAYSKYLSEREKLTGGYKSLSSSKDSLDTNRTESVSKTETVVTSASVTSATNGEANVSFSILSAFSL